MNTTGMVEKIAILLDHNFAHSVAVKALLVATRDRASPSSRIGESVAKLNLKLSRILIDSEDNGVIEVVLAAMTRANRLALWTSRTLSPSTLNSFVVPSMLSNVLTFLGPPVVSRFVLQNTTDVVKVLCILWRCFVQPSPFVIWLAVL